ncbi:MAG: hypothetical protein QMC67_08135 [Candidatus Wallbacteria bacterium]
MNFKTVSIILLIVLSLAFEITFVHHYTCDENIFTFQKNIDSDSHRQDNHFPNTAHQAENNGSDKPSHSHESNDCHSCSAACEFCGKVFFNSGLAQPYLLYFYGFFHETYINAFAAFFFDPLFHPPNSIIS